MHGRRQLEADANWTSLPQAHTARGAQTESAVTSQKHSCTWQKQGESLLCHPPTGAGSMPQPNRKSPLKSSFPTESTCCPSLDGVMEHVGRSNGLRRAGLLLPGYEGWFQQQQFSLHAESQSPRMGWVGRDLRAHLLPLPSTAQAAQGCGRCPCPRQGDV